MNVKYIFGIVVTLTLLSVSNVVAAEGYTLLESVPWAETNSDFSNYITGVYNFLIAIVAICALLMITIGGFYYIMAAGNQAQAGTAKKIITDAILGLVVVFVTYLILNTINAALVKGAPDFSKLRQAAHQNPATQASTLNRKKIERSTTVCGVTGSGSVQCFETAEECGGAPGISECSLIQDSFKSDAFYSCNSSGCKEYPNKEFCESAGEADCISGDAAKGKFFYSVKNEQEKIEQLNNAGVAIQEGVSVDGVPAVTINAVIDAGEPGCKGGCEKKIIHTEGKGSNYADIADDSGSFLDSKLLNSIQSDAKAVKTETKTLPGGGMLTKNVQKVTTYIYPKGHEKAGQSYQVIQTGIQTRGPGGLIPGSFAVSTSKIRVFGEKSDSPPDTSYVDIHPSELML